MRSKRNLPIFIGYALAALLVLGYLATQMGGEFFFDRGYRVKAEFATGAQLVAGDDVTISGLRVGKVDTLQPANGGAEAVLLLHSQFAPLFHDAHAVIKSKNLLGETYVELARGTGGSGRMANGGVIPQQHTLTPVEIDRILDVLDQNTRDRLVVLLNTLGQATAGNGSNLNTSAGDLRVLAGALSRIATAVASQSSDLDILISSLSKVLDTLAAWHAEFRAMITDWDRLMTTLAAREQALEGTFVQQDRVMSIFEQALAGSSATSLHSAIQNAPQTLDNTDHYLGDSSVVFPQLANNTPSIAGLFYELASVMSGTDPNGNHMWRVYQVSGPQEASVPCNPYVTPCGVTGQPLPSPSAGGGR